MIGRSAELRAVRAAISAPDAGGIVIGGPAGVGKSRLAREALSVAASRRCETRWTVGTSSARSIPLGAFTAWTPSGVTDTVGLLRGVIEALTAGNERATVVVGVDDAHLLDDLSTFVVHQIVSRRAAKVVLTVRDGAPIPAALQEIWQAAAFDRLDLQPLSSDETTALLAATLGGSVATDAAERLWRMTRGNALYLRNIVEQEVADGRIVHRQDCWRWTGDPIVPPGLAELIESRMGELPAPVSDVIDVLAVGEPLDLATLTRITDPAAVEEADIRGLITLEPAGGGIEVRVAHPLYGEVRRKRAAPTRLRRLRGLVATELASAGDHDDVRVVVRRAALTLDSDLTPDADLLVTAARARSGSPTCPSRIGWREAAIRAGAGPEPNFVRAHALSWLGRGEEAEAVLADIRTDELTDQDHARFAFLRSSNMLWALGDPARAKESSTTRRVPRRRMRAPTSTPSSRSTGSRWTSPRRRCKLRKTLRWTTFPSSGAEIAWALAQIAADAGRTTEAVAVAEAGYTVATRSLDAPHMRFNIADAHVSALLLAGRVADALDVAERMRQQAADLPGRLNCSVPPWRAGPRSVPATCDTHACCWSRRYDGLSASHRDRLGIPLPFSAT